MDEMKLISLNTARRGRKLDQQVELLLSRRPSLIALQEVTVTTVSRWRDALRTSGYYVDDTTRLIDSETRKGARSYGVLLASRWPFDMKPSRAIPWPERLLTAAVRTPFGPVAIHAAHIPCGSSHGRVKIETLTGIHDLLARPARGHRILCGDFNTPQVETLGGDTITWAWRQRKDGTWALRPGRSPEWDHAELAILRGLAGHGLPDTFRSLYGFASAEGSWVAPRTKQARRYDHVFASASLNTTACQYLHEFRERALSDHSAIEAVFRPYALVQAA
jgi:endonuclease/exonuclease/phosphatase family metal-dependent hydrolase